MSNLIILASSSPRRHELLKQIRVRHQVYPTEVDETPKPHESPTAHVMRLAKAKAQAARAALETDLPVLGADTAVIIDGQILGKPSTQDLAFSYLRRLSGRCHEVLSAVCLNLSHPPRNLAALSISRVYFRKLSEEEIYAYWHTGEPKDKAGAYAIQGIGAIFVERLEGSFSGVMGLPLYETACLLKEAGICVL